MEDLVIILLIAVLVGVGIYSSRKHFRGEGGCCGGSSAPVKKQRKKLKTVVAQKTVRIEGMSCEHCKNRVEAAINEIEGASASVNLRKKEAVVSMEREISDDQIRTAIEKAGYHVTEL